MDFWKWIHVFTVNGWGKIFKGFDRLFLLLERYTKAEKIAFNKALAIIFTASIIAILVSFRFSILEQYQLYFQLLVMCISIITIVPPFIYSVCTSTMACVGFLTFINFFTAFLISYSIIYANALNHSMLFSLWILIYALIWLFISLLANTKVAKLSNEIVSGLFVLIYTTLTYFISLLSDKLILNYLSNVIPDVPSAYWVYLQRAADEGYGPTKLLLIIVGVCLPFIGLSCISIVLISLKEYWFEKYGEHD